WSPGGSAVIINMGQDLYTAFPSDYGGEAGQSVSFFGGGNSLRDGAYFISLAARNPRGGAWVVFWKEKNQHEMGGRWMRGVVAERPNQRFDRRSPRRSRIREPDRTKGARCRGYGRAVGDPSRHHCACGDLQCILLLPQATARPRAGFAVKAGD